MGKYIENLYKQLKLTNHKIGINYEEYDESKINHINFIDSKIKKYFVCGDNLENPLPPYDEEHPAAICGLITNFMNEQYLVIASKSHSPETYGVWGYEVFNVQNVNKKLGEIYKFTKHFFKEKEEHVITTEVKTAKDDITLNDFLRKGFADKELGYVVEEKHFIAG